MNPEKVIAIVCAYWESRLENIKRIISDLNEGTVIPYKIIILNNNGAKFSMAELSQLAANVVVVDSQLNTRTRGKYVVGLLEPADYYLMLDDDTSVSPKTLEALLRYAAKDRVLGYCGTNYEGGNGFRIYPSSVTELTPTQYFLGCGIFGSFHSIIRLLMVEENLRIPYGWEHEGDDILMGLANNSFVPPLREGEGFVDLSWGTEAMSWGSDGITQGGSAYLEMRNRFTRDAMKVISEKGIPEF